MTSTSQQPEGRGLVLPTLDVFIQILNIAKDSCGIPPAQIAFGSASVLLTMIRDTMSNDQDYIDLGRACGDVCQVLYRRLRGKRLDVLNQSILDAIGDLTLTLAGIQKKVVKQGKRNVAFRFILAKSNKDKITAWKEDIARVLNIFNTELTIDTNLMVAETHIAVADTQTAVADTKAVVIDTHTVVADTHAVVENTHTAVEDTLEAVSDTRTMVADIRSVLAGQQGKSNSTQARMPSGESPPPAPRDCFGRDDLIKRVIRLAEDLEPVALIGAGGIGKTSIALTVLHHNLIEERFGENRRFIRCDQFPASRTHFLARLSKVIGAGVENPEDLAPLRPLLSSKEMLIILDNAESILDPKEPGAKEIYPIVDELCQFKKLSLFITSRITIVPPRCKRPEIPTLSMEAACDIFYGIYGDDKQSNTINNLLRHLDFHALSIKLLATTASHNAWDYDRLAEEWHAQRAQVLQTDYNESLAKTIELSLTSLTFLSLGPDARNLLGVIAFFPHGVYEKNLDWLFPTIADRKNIFDKFCVLSLAYRSNGFIMMLAPLRDYLSPRDPLLSPLHCTTRDRYFSRLSAVVQPGKPGFEESRWIVLEDMNVEHLLDVFTSTNQTNHNVWEACFHFVDHLVWHKPRSTILGLKIEALPDNHPFKPKCLNRLSGLFQQLGNHVERKRLLAHILKLERQRGNDAQVAETLRSLSRVNRLQGLYSEGIPQAKEALEIYERINNTLGQARSLGDLASLLRSDRQLDAAENAASRAIDLAPKEGQGYLLCSLHRALGQIHQVKGEKDKAIDHFKVALEIASPPNWRDALCSNHCSLVANLFRNEHKFDDANAHIEQAKSHAVDNAYWLGHAMDLQATIWNSQGRLEDAKLEALRALEIFEKVGAASDAVRCRNFLRTVERAMNSSSTRS